MNLLEGTTVEIHSTLLPVLTFDVGAEGEPTALARFLRPRVVVRKAGVTAALIDVAPAGDPSTAPRWGLLVLAGIGALLLWRFAR